MNDTQPVGPGEPAAGQTPAGPADTTHFGERERIHFFPDAGAAWELTRTARTDGFISCLCMHGRHRPEPPGELKTPDGVVHPLARASRVGDVPDMVVSFAMPVRRGDQWIVAGVRAGMEDATREVIVYWTPLVHHKDHD